MIREAAQNDSKTGKLGPEAAARLADAARGDRGAQQEILLEYLPRVRALVRRLVGPGADCEDLVQTACIEILRSLPRFRAQASLRLWIDRITARTVYKHFRTTRRRRARFGWISDPDTRASQFDQTRRLESREALGRAHELVASIKPERRIVFLLVALEGRSLQEAADVLDLSLSATKSRYLRARRDLDRLLAREPGLVELLTSSSGSEP
ncbi:MAG: RNA polymerase sigma factor [Deltaproteobacteria bacterium]|nr:RNA polymerase sigma factor [Deltaproteobacteria bacterium]